MYSGVVPFCGKQLESDSLISPKSTVNKSTYMHGVNMGERAKAELYQCCVPLD